MEQFRSWGIVFNAKKDTGNDYSFPCVIFFLLNCVINTHAYEFIRDSFLKFHLKARREFAAMSTRARSYLEKYPDFRQEDKKIQANRHTPECHILPRYISMTHRCPESSSARRNANLSADEIAAKVHTPLHAGIR